MTPHATRIRRNLVPTASAKIPCRLAGFHAVDGEHPELTWRIPAKYGVVSRGCVGVVLDAVASTSGVIGTVSTARTCVERMNGAIWYPSARI